MQKNYLENLYQKLPESQSINNTLFVHNLSIINQENSRFQYPTITKDCDHVTKCFELQFILEQINTKKQFVCPTCDCIAKEQDLVKDLRYKVQVEFNELTTNIMIIEGVLLNKSSRKKRFFDPFIQPEIRSLFKGLFKMQVCKEISINTLLIQELKFNHSYEQGVNKRIEFWALCLQDKVKITIPVRIIGCKHLECYELTSLLLLQQEQNESFYYCAYPGCDNPKKKIDISTPKNLFSMISIDYDLLQLIKLSNPYSMKFIFNYYTQKFEEDILRLNGKIIDPTIEKYYNLYLKNSSIKFEEFQQQVFVQIAQVCQNDLFKDQTQQKQLQQLEKNLSYQKYRNFQVNMKDQLTEMIIEQPVRCRNCNDLSKCLDIKSYCCEYIKTKINHQTSVFTCPLCKNAYQSQITKSQIYNYIYLDQNLLSRIFKDLSYRTTSIFNYQGRDYMIDEFCERQKISKQDYINNLKQKNQKLNVEFKSIFCGFDKNKKLSIPLLLDQCPLKTVIDFDTLYELMKKCNFNLEQGLILCKCRECNIKPITSISGKIFYHEAFDYALKVFYKTNSKEISFSFDFEKGQLTSSQAVPDSIALNDTNVYMQRGFLGMLNDEEYQTIFGQKIFEGKYCQVVKIRQNVCDGLDVEYDANGVASNLKEKKEKMNEYFQKNQDFQKWGFKIQQVEVQLNNNHIFKNKGMLFE